jgi:hypothetical protein
LPMAIIYDVDFINNFRSYAGFYGRGSVGKAEQQYQL